MFSRFTIETRPSVVEAEERLRRMVRAPESFWHYMPRPEDDTRPFEGRVQDGSFKFHRVIRGRNSFLPIISGRVEQSEGGALIRGRMRMAIVVMLFMACWMGFAITAAIDRLSKQPWRDHGMDVLGAALLPLFGGMLIVTGFYPERRKALRLLRDAFQPTTPIAPR